MGERAAEESPSHSPGEREGERGEVVKVYSPPAAEGGGRTTLAAERRRRRRRRGAAPRTAADHTHPLPADPHPSEFKTTPPKRGAVRARTAAPEPTALPR